VPPIQFELTRRGRARVLKSYAEGKRELLRKVLNPPCMKAKSDHPSEVKTKKKVKTKFDHLSSGRTRSGRRGRDAGAAGAGRGGEPLLDA